MNAGKQEYDKPLCEQSEINQRKNIGAALDVVKFWSRLYGECDLEKEMKSAVDYETNQGRESLERCAESQHEQWKRFVRKYQAERITPREGGFRKDKKDLPPKEGLLLSG